MGAMLAMVKWLERVTEEKQPAEIPNNNYKAENDTAIPNVMPSTNMAWAILTTLFCFLPFGIVAIIKASQG